MTMDFGCAVPFQHSEMYQLLQLVRVVQQHVMAMNARIKEVLGKVGTLITLIYIL